MSLSKKKLPKPSETLDVAKICINKKKAKAVRKKSSEKAVVPNSRWECLPDIVLEDIFAMLAIRERYYASQVCRNWNRIFYATKVWHTFILDDRTLTRRKFNYYMGYQPVLDHHRTQICLYRMGRSFRHIIINPMEFFFNLYEFMVIACHFSKIFEDKPLKQVRTLRFTFSCDTVSESSDKDERVFGTGGKLLEALKKLMISLTGLKHLSLQDLLLDEKDAMTLLDDVVYNRCETLQTLTLINCTKEPYAILHAGVFVNLRTLTISPQHLGDDVVALLGYTQLRDLYIIQTKHTCNCAPVSPKAWKECMKQSPLLRVHQIVEGKIKTEVLWQEGAAVRSVIYNTSYSRGNVPSLLICAGLYRDYLEVYAQKQLPRYYMPRPFQDRVDSSLMMLCRSCPRLHTLMIRDRVSTSTVLLLAYYTKSVRRLIIRRNALIKRCDWPYNPEWTLEFYQWLKNSSQSYETTAKEISRLLGSRWQPLSDNEFKLFRP